MTADASSTVSTGAVRSQAAARVRGFADSGKTLARYFLPVGSNIIPQEEKWSVEIYKALARELVEYLRHERAPAFLEARTYRFRAHSMYDPQLYRSRDEVKEWEWGVTLFAHEPLDFKRLVTDMRFDEVSARYGEFGRFFTGIRMEGDGWRSLLAAD